MTAAVLAISLAACAGSAEPAATGSAEGGASATETIRLANFGTFPNAMPLMWAIEGGYFDKQNVKVELLPAMLNATDMVNAVMNDEADLAMTAPSAIAFARSAGRPAVNVGTVMMGYSLEIGFTPETVAKLEAKGITKDSPLKERVEALKGMTLGSFTAGSSTDAAFRYLVKENGVDPDHDMTLQPIADQAAQVAALRAKRIDGLVATAPGNVTAAAANGTAITWDFWTGDKLLPKVGMIIFAGSEESIKKKPEAIQRFLEAVSEARADIVAGLSAEDSAKLKKVMGADMPDGVWQTTLDSLSKLMGEPFTMTDASWESTMTLVNLQSDTPIKVPASEAINNTFAELIK
ncbi:ABC transporter substrate-binding protein [Pseudarthrobacter sulfonivorans]|uniref:ABC transporter substrate-binding protein n=1 Tax=Pseudarthrobacter sulfonivorans TaxID=121292 RepID=UPI0021026DBA|nr:ABC transporter substrate-binding protein [Pseudarthrobacter sulfonivorans]